ncbi:Dabb family protein [Enterococcus sp. BWB1-3]|uniref:Dabb family protein n=1 Tax=unclassified Enterococcus TaxID=2608891 RepID=UPI001922ECFC|nr:MULTISPECIES: Dabb family protein [unclassified Enterococcus]MBL1230244.1 Dabb family protein [Enterococcus sp. BWB1-3]MCB5951112.1 Dabb family protein [Enterococcus sp. BWT-B8]
MIRHIVAWHFKDNFTDEEKTSLGQKIKEELEALKSVIPGIVSLEVITELLDTSTHDVVLCSLHEDEEALKAYQTHPEHIRVGGFIKSVTANRVCVDFKQKSVGQ